MLSKDLLSFPTSSFFREVWHAIPQSRILVTSWKLCAKARAVAEEGSRGAVLWDGSSFAIIEGIRQTRRSSNFSIPSWRLLTWYYCHKSFCIFLAIFATSSVNSHLLWESKHPFLLRKQVPQHAQRHVGPLDIEQVETVWRFGKGGLVRCLMMPWLVGSGKGPSNRDQQTKPLPLVWVILGLFFLQVLGHLSLLRRRKSLTNLTALFLSCRMLEDTPSAWQTA